MSTSDPAAAKIRLRVEPATRATEIFVVDASFALVARAVGRLDTRLDPGLYKIKVREGDSIREQPLLLRAGSSALLDSPSVVEQADDPFPTAIELSENNEGVRLTYPSQRFVSAAPLGKTSRSHEYQRDAATEHSTKVHVARGGNSQIFVFARRWTKDDTRPGAKVHPAVGVSLHDLGGRLVADFGQEGIADFTQDPWAACNVALPAETYCLRRSDIDEEPIERAVVAIPGWQTQVFLLSQPEGATSEGQAVRQSAILLAPIGVGFSAWDEDVRLTELARWGLANSRVVVDDWALDAMMAGKFQNPMLGIFAGHLLLQRRSSEQTHQSHRRVVAEILRNLRQLVGTIPDVEALALALDEPPADPRVFSRPPMLSSSWSLIIQRSVRNPDLVPVGSSSWLISDRLWTNPPWLAWTAVPSEAMLAAAEGAGVGSGEEQAVPVAYEWIAQAPPAPAGAAPVASDDSEGPVEAGAEMPPLEYATPAAEGYDAMPLPATVLPSADVGMASKPDTSSPEERAAPEPATGDAPAPPVFGTPVPPIPETTWPEDLAEVMDALRRALSQVDELPELTAVEELVVSTMADRGRYIVADPSSGRNHFKRARTTSPEARGLSAEALARRLGLPPRKLGTVMRGLLLKLDADRSTAPPLASANS